MSTTEQLPPAVCELVKSYNGLPFAVAWQRLSSEFETYSAAQQSKVTKTLADTSKVADKFRTSLQAATTARSAKRVFLDYLRLSSPSYISRYRQLEEGGTRLGDYDEISESTEVVIRIFVAGWRTDGHRDAYTTAASVPISKLREMHNAPAYMLHTYNTLFDDATRLVIRALRQFDRITAYRVRSGRIWSVAARLIEDYGYDDHLLSTDGWWEGFAEYCVAHRADAFGISASVRC